MENKAKLVVFLLIIGGLNLLDATNENNSLKENVISTTNSCCENLYFSTTGPLGNSEQKYVLGYYSKLSDGPEDYWNYKKNESSTKKLWYNPDRHVQAWIIGNDLGTYIGINTKLQKLAKILSHLGTSRGFALAYGTNTCPENLPRIWEYWHWQKEEGRAFETGEWVKDDKAYMACVDHSQINFSRKLN